MLALSVLSLASLAIATPVKSVHDYAASLRIAARQSVNEADVDNFAFFAEHASAAYCNSEASAGSAITCGPYCPTIEANGATIIGTYSGLFTGIAGYVSVDEARSEIVFSVRGSNNIRNWISNLNFELEDSDLAPGAEVHDGFNTAWNEMASGVTSAIRNALAANPGFKVVATGHSLGGAVATLGAAALRKRGIAVDIYSYGAPRVGNGALSDFISSQPGPEFRITHLDDPVSRLPPIIFGYRHTSPEYWLSGSEATMDEYPVEEIRVCPGNANIRCNAGTFGLNVGAHGTYFGDVSGCDDVVAARAEGDAELEDRLNAWVAEDIAFVESS